MTKWWQPKVTPFYDHTMEEVAAILTSGEANLASATKLGSCHLIKLLLQACLRTTTQRSLLTGLTRLTWRSWLRCKTISVGLNLPFIFFLPGAHPEGPRHLELGSTGWDFFHQEPGTNTEFSLSWSKHKWAIISKSGKWGKSTFCDISVRLFITLNSFDHI